MGIVFLATPPDRKRIGEKELAGLAQSYQEAYPGLSGEAELGCLAPEEIRELNLQYRGIDQPTDVLSFPTFASLEAIGQAGEAAPSLIGSIAICPEKVATYGESLVQMVHHGLLHLLGFDHQTDWPAWEQEERRVLAIATTHGLMIPPVSHATL